MHVTQMTCFLNSRPQIKLGVSPVLRGVLSSLEARLDARPCISLQEFNTEAVTCLLNFIYTGEVGTYI